VQVSARDGDGPHSLKTSFLETFKSGRGSKQSQRDSGQGPHQRRDCPGRPRCQEQLRLGVATHTTASGVQKPFLAASATALRPYAVQNAFYFSNHSCQHFKTQSSCPGDRALCIEHGFTSRRVLILQLQKPPASRSGKQKQLFIPTENMEKATEYINPRRSWALARLSETSEGALSLTPPALRNSATSNLKLDPVAKASGACPLWLTVILIT
jgi:hypothetical protein